MVPRPAPPRPPRITRVLVVDDSPTFRTLLRFALRDEPGIQVVGEASNGVEAVERTLALRPDVVTMDVRMPRMDGLEATKRIMAECPTPIVVVSAMDRDGSGVAVSILALRAGALAAVPKPGGQNSPSFGQDLARLLETVKSMASIRLARPGVPAAPGRPGPDARPRAGPRGRARLVAVTSSTGGPAALQHLLADLPPEFPAPILLVQHMAQGFVEGFATWLDSVCSLRVRVGEEGAPLEPGVAYLAPDDRHLGVGRRGEVALSSVPPVDGCRPSGTFLFQSVAAAYGPGAVAVVLTGMGADGVAGLRAVRDAGGRVLAQDRDSSVVWGMAGAAAAAGLVDESFPPAGIAKRLAELAG